MKKFWFAAGLLAALYCSCESPMVRATTPAARWEESKQKPGLSRFLDKRKQAENNAGRIRIVFLGDSITHFWEWQDRGKPVYDKEFVPYGVLNLANAGDRTQHLLYITEKSGILEMLHPKLIVMLIGTNNLGHHECGAAETIAGIEKCVASVRRACPEAKVLLFGIFPRGIGRSDPEFGAPIAEINAEIAKLHDGQNVFYCDLTYRLLSRDGTLRSEIMPDLLHPSTRGYRIWAAAIRPYVEKYVK